VAGFVYALTS